MKETKQIPRNPNQPQKSKTMATISLPLSSTK
jgi:hypothetical protein